MTYNPVGTYSANASNVSMCGSLYRFLAPPYSALKYTHPRRIVASPSGARLIPVAARTPLPCREGESWHYPCGFSLSGG